MEPGVGATDAPSLLHEPRRTPLAIFEAGRGVVGNAAVNVFEKTCMAAGGGEADGTARRDAKRARKRAFRPSPRQDPPCKVPQELLPPRYPKPCHERVLPRDSLKVSVVVYAPKEGKPLLALDTEHRRIPSPGHHVYAIHQQGGDAHRPL